MELKKSYIIPIILSTCLFVSQSLFAQFSYEKRELKSDTEKPFKLHVFPQSRFNRVEGLFLDLGLTWRPILNSNFLVYGEAGWGFWNESNKQFRFKGGVRKTFGERNPLGIGAEYFKSVDSEDDWVNGHLENSISSISLADDHRDYYSAQGFEVYTDKWKKDHYFRIEVGRVTYAPLQKNINSILGSNFEENPARRDTLQPEFLIAEGSEVGIKLIASFDFRYQPDLGLGWIVDAMYERTFEDFNTDGVFFTARFGKETYGNQKLLFRGMLGTRHGSLAEQHIMDIGGIGSLRGFANNEFGGNRMFMLNFDYLFDGDIFGRIPFAKIPYAGLLLQHWTLGLFVDTGWAWVTNPGDGVLDGFGQLTFDNLKTDIGISFSLNFVDFTDFSKGIIRLDIAKRTDRSHDDFLLTVRIEDEFLFELFDKIGL